MSHSISQIFNRRLACSETSDLCFWSASTTLYLTNGQLQKKLPKAWYFAGSLFSYLGRPLTFSRLHPRFNPTVAWIPHHVILQEEPKHSRSDEDGQDAGDPQKDRSSRNPWRPTVAVKGKSMDWVIGWETKWPTRKAFNYVWRYLNPLLRKSRKDFSSLHSYSKVDA